MYFDHSGGGEQPPVRTEAQIHAIYRKLFSLVKSMRKPSDIARAVVIALEGLFGADGAVLCHIFDDGARFVAASGILSHMEMAAFELDAPSMKPFLLGACAKILTHEQLSQEYRAATLNAKFESVLLSPVSLSGVPYGFIGLVSRRSGYYSDADAETLYQLTVYISMLLATREAELSDNEQHHSRRLGQVCHKLAPGLHSATIDLIQTFAVMRKSYVEQKYHLMAEPLAKAVSNIENMAKRIQDLRTLGELCMARQGTFENVQIRPLIENVLDYNRVQIEECARLECTIDDDVPDIYGDFTLLWQAVHELIQNSIRAMCKRKEMQSHVLSVHAYALPSAAIIEVSDTGCGIEPADVPNIFEPFYTSWAPCKGLGLTRVQLNTLGMHGKVMYYPRPEGGASFRILLPDARHTPQTEIF